MKGTLGLVLSAVAVMTIGTSPAAAQRLMRTEASVGGVMVPNVAVGGLYLDAGTLLLPATSVVGEVQVFPSVVSAAEFAALGGVRQRLFRSSQGYLYAQALLGGATGYSRRCGVCIARVTELGLGASVRVDPHWAVRVRGDLRIGGSAGDLFYPMLGAGITRVW